MSDSVTPWATACQVLLYMEFSRQEYWSRLPFPPPGALPHPGIKPKSPALQVDSLLSKPPGNSIDMQLTFVVYLLAYDAQLIYSRNFCRFLGIVYE